MEAKTDILCPRCQRPIIGGATKDGITGKYIGYTVCRKCRKLFTEVRLYDKAGPAKDKAVRNLQNAMSLCNKPEKWNI